MRRSPSPAIAFMALVISAVPACAAILGDDFVVVDEDDDNDNGSTTSGSGCDQQPDCVTCAQCECPDEWAACAGSDCPLLNDCRYYGCPDPDCTDVCAYPDEHGGAELDALLGCSCAGACGALCGCPGT